jgi:IS30 family transposase
LRGLYSYRAIARTLGRSVSTISDELGRNKVNGTYDSLKAQTKATVRRKASKYQGKKIVNNRTLRTFIDKALLAGQSPGAIAGRLKTGREPGLPYASRDTIETYIRSVYGRIIEYELKVLKAGQKRRGRKKRPGIPQTGDEKVYIDDRPTVITNRKRVGDLEVDFIVSGKAGSGSMLTAADRKLRVGFIQKILPVSVAGALQAILNIKQVFPEIQSVTTDNDILFRYHKKLEEAVGVPFYFCHPYSSWEKGSIENYNGQVRKYIKKGSDISQHSEVYMAMVEQKLNSRYMAVIGYQTPAEALDEYRNQSKNEQPR